MFAAIVLAAIVGAIVGAFIIHSFDSHQPYIGWIDPTDIARIQAQGSTWIFVSTHERHQYSLPIVVSPGWADDTLGRAE